MCGRADEEWRHRNGTQVQSGSSAPSEMMEPRPHPHSFLLVMGIFQGLSSFVGLGLLPPLALPSLGTHRDLQRSGAQHVDSRTLVMVEGDSLLVGLWMLSRGEDSIFSRFSSEASYKSSRPSSFSTSSRLLLLKLSSLSDMTPHHMNHAPQPPKAPHMVSLSDMTPSWQTQEPCTTAA